MKAKPLKMNKRRLLTLAKKLDKVPVEKFNIRFWISDRWKGRPDLSCGAAACAMGWATAITSFRRAGLTLQRRGQKPALRRVGKRTLFELDAAEAFFGIDNRQSRHLFMPQSYPYSETHFNYQATPKMVARRIRQMVKAA